jgi:hypothetical protein
MNAVDQRRSAPHVARNSGAIIDVLKGVLPSTGLVLELASGSGEHALAFARAFPCLNWQPSDADPAALQSIDAWRQAEALPNLHKAVELDAAAADWPISGASAILCINMVHISPWPATQGLLAGAARLLGQDAPLYLYGAYRRQGLPTAASNEAFDASLRARDPRWGLRRLEDVAAEAMHHGLRLDGVIEMPANNLSVVFRRA